jgi:hypothetical protein
MKRLLLLFIPLMFFFGCEDDDSNNDDSSICGNVSVTINGENRDYNPNTSFCTQTVLSMNGGYGVSINFTSYCDNNNVDYTVGVGLNNFSNNNVWSFGPSLGMMALTNCNSVVGIPDFNYSDGTGTIDNIDYETRTIDGSFYLPPGDNGRPEVQCSFSNVPFL